MKVRVEDADALEDATVERDEMPAMAVGLNHVLAPESEHLPRPRRVHDLPGRSFDLIIDDGSHQLADILATLRVFLPRLRAGGVYAVEDLPHSRPLTDIVTVFANLEFCVEIHSVRSVQGWAGLAMMRSR